MWTTFVLDLINIDKYNLLTNYNIGLFLELEDAMDIENLTTEGKELPTYRPTFFCCLTTLFSLTRKNIESFIFANSYLLGFQNKTTAPPGDHKYILRTTIYSMNRNTHFSFEMNSRMIMRCLLNLVFN